MKKSKRSRGREVKGSRGQGVERSRGRGVKGSRGQEVKRSRGREVKGSRGQGVERSRGQEVERIKVAGSKIPLRERQKNCYFKEPYPRWQRKEITIIIKQKNLVISFALSPNEL